jgi:hypothetical protein
MGIDAAGGLVTIQGAVRALQEQGKRASYISVYRYLKRTNAPMFFVGPTAMVDPRALQGYRYGRQYN